MNLSVICPVYNEERYILSFIESIIHQDYKNGEIEIFIIDGMSSDNTKAIVNEYVLNNSSIHLIDNPKKTVSYGLNLGINRAKGDYIIRLDAHAEFPENYFTILIANAEQLGADNVGGIINTIPANLTVKAKAIAIALSHIFGMGNSHFRVGAKNIRKVDTVPFGCFRRDIFNRIGLFDVDLIRNQDDEFNGRIIKNNGKIFLIPKLIVKYYARDTIDKVAKMFYQYGLFKPLVNKKLGIPATIRQFFPLFFVGGLLVGFILCFLNESLRILYIFVLAIYFFISFYFSFIEALKQKKIEMLFTLQYIFFIVHFSYGLGYLVGIYHFIILKKNKMEVNESR